MTAMVGEFDLLADILFLAGCVRKLKGNVDKSKVLVIEWESRLLILESQSSSRENDSSVVVGSDWICVLSYLILYLFLTHCHIYVISCPIFPFQVIFREDCTSDELIDVISGNRVYMPCLYVYNKIDQVSIEEVDRVAHLPHSVVVRCVQRGWASHIPHYLHVFIIVLTSPHHTCHPFMPVAHTLCHTLALTMQFYHVTMFVCVVFGTHHHHWRLCSVSGFTTYHTSPVWDFVCLKHTPKHHKYRLKDYPRRIFQGATL